MLSFLNSIVLPLLIAASIPLLIHFFNRRKTKTIKFSSLRFLKLLESRRIKHVRLYQILLIIVRTLFIIFLVLAFARPALKSVLSGGGASSNTTAVILLDDSYSMQTSSAGGSYFDKAKEYLQPILSSFQSGDFVYLLSPQPDSSQLKPLSLPAGGLGRRLQAANISPYYDESLKKASEIFSIHQNVNNEFYFLSDFQIPVSSLKDTLQESVFSKPVKVYLMQAGGGGKVQNTGIDTLYIADQFPEINKPVTVKVSLRNYSSDQDIESVVHLFNGDKRAAMETFTIPASGRVEAALRFTPEKPGYQLLHAEIDDDDLLADNSRYFTMHFSEKIKLLAVETGQASFLHNAVKALSANTNLNVETASYSSWQGKSFLSYDVMLLHAPPAVNPETEKRLKAFLGSGKGLILIPGPSQNADDFNRISRSLLGSGPVKGLTAASDDGSFYTLSDDFLQKPVFSRLFTKADSRPGLPVVYKYFNLASSGEPIISLSSGSPFIQKYNSSGGSVIVFASAMDKEWTGFPYTGLFVPLLYRMVYAAARGNQQQKSYPVSKNIKFFSKKVLRGAGCFLKPPDEAAYPVIPAESPSGQYFNFSSIDVPGHYLLLEDDKIKDVFSVNLSSRELKGPFLNMDQLFPGAETVSDIKGLKEMILENRQGLELWLFFLAAALLMLAAEMLLIRRIEGATIKQPEL